MPQDQNSNYRDRFPDLPEPEFEPLRFTRIALPVMRERARDWYEECERRRTARQFSREAVPRELIEYAIRTANTAPSGAHLQPWQFVVVDDPDLKRQIRAAAEAEEYKSYTERMSDEWRLELAKLGTDWVKSHITDAPWLVVLFRQRYRIMPDGSRRKNYYVEESVGICAGLFIAAIHHMGLCTLTHTPNPMQFLNELLRRPPNESAVLLFPVGYPAAEAEVPRLRRKSLPEIVQWNQGR